MSFTPTLIFGLIFIVGVLIGFIPSFLAGRRLNKSNHPEQKPRSSQSFQVVSQEWEKWSPEDTAMFRGFFSTPTGVKLYRVCLAKIHNEALKECGGDKTAPVAAGMYELLCFQQNLCSNKLERDLLSQAQAQEADNTTDGLREADSVET